MEIFEFMKIFLLIFCIILFFLFLIFINKFKKLSNYVDNLKLDFNNKLNILKEETLDNETYDTLFHFSTETLTFDGVYNLLLKYDTDIVNLNQCYFTDQVVSYQSKMDYNDIPPIKYNSTNYIQHINNKYIEMFYNDNYFGLSKNKFKLISDIKFYKGNYENTMFIASYKRLEDNKNFIYVSMTQKYNGYLTANKYKGITQLINTFKTLHPNELYIMVGDLNVHGHEEIFKSLLKDSLVCDVYKNVCTCNDNEGLASPDALVVSNKLYKKIEYEIDFFKGYTYQHYPLMVKLYKEGKNEVINKTNKGFLKTIEDYIKTTSRDVFINKKGIFDISQHNDKNMCKEIPIKNFYNDKSVSKRNRAYTQMFLKNN